MELDVRAAGDALSIPIADPFRLDLDSIVDRIGAFLSGKGIAAGDLDLVGLIPKMVKGIAGCEKGCPANAKSLVSQGFKNFRLEYIEGGILTATTAAGGSEVVLKMFPDF